MMLDYDLNKDTKERNAQILIMEYIFPRAYKQKTLREEIYILQRTSSSCRKFCISSAFCPNS